MGVFLGGKLPVPREHSERRLVKHRGAEGEGEWWSRQNPSVPPERYLPCLEFKFTWLPLLPEPAQPPVALG